MWHTVDRRLKDAQRSVGGKWTSKA